MGSPCPLFTIGPSTSGVIFFLIGVIVDVTFAQEIFVFIPLQANLYPLYDYPIRMEVRYDFEYIGVPCSRGRFSFLPNSRISNRPEKNGDDTYLLSLKEFVYLMPSERLTVDLGLRLIFSGCPFVINISGTSGCGFSLNYNELSSSNAPLDLVVVLESVSAESLVLPPDVPFCTLRLQTRCLCNTVSAPSQASILPVSNSLVTSNAFSCQLTPDILVSVCGFRIMDHSEEPPIEKIFRWIYSDYPFMRKLTLYSAATGIKSVEVSGIFEFYRHLFGLNGYQRVLIYTDTPGIHDLFNRYSISPTNIPGRYRSSFQRDRFVATYRYLPAVVLNVGLNNEFVTSSYRAFLTQFRQELVLRRLELIDPCTYIINDLISHEFADVPIYAPERPR